MTYEEKIKRTYQRLFWEAWVERFTTERMWRIWQLAEDAQWQGPIHPAHIIELLSQLKGELCHDHSQRSLH